MSELKVIETKAETSTDASPLSSPLDVVTLGDWVKLGDPPPPSPAQVPPKPRTLVEIDSLLPKPEFRQDLFSLPEGAVTVTWPGSLSPDSYQDFGDWLDILKRKIGRSVLKPEIPKD